MVHDNAECSIVPQMTGNIRNDHLRMFDILDGKQKCRMRECLFGKRERMRDIANHIGMVPLLRMAFCVLDKGWSAVNPRVCNTLWDCSPQDSLSAGNVKQSVAGDKRQ
jgi:hypothetical protein